MEAVTELIQSSQSKYLIFFEFSRVSPGVYPLNIKPEDSGYEIVRQPEIRLRSQATFRHSFLKTPKELS